MIRDRSQTMRQVMMVAKGTSPRGKPKLRWPGKTQDPRFRECFSVATHPVLQKFCQLFESPESLSKQTSALYPLVTFVPAQCRNKLLKV